MPVAVKDVPALEPSLEARHCGGASVGAGAQRDLELTVRDPHRNRVVMTAAMADLAELEGRLLRRGTCAPLDRAGAYPGRAGPS